MTSIRKSGSVLDGYLSIAFSIVLGIMAIAYPAAADEELLSEDSSISFPVLLERAAPEIYAYSTPFQAAVSLYSAMLRGNYEAWLNSWEEKERTRRLEMDKKMGRDASFWTEKWAQNFSRETLRFVRMARYRNYVLVGYEMVGSSGAVVLKSSAVFKEVANGDWRATQDLASDPVSQNFP